jgi:hypothetical protein
MPSIKPLFFLKLKITHYERQYSVTKDLLSLSLSLSLSVSKFQRLEVFPVPNKGKDKSQVHPRTGHEGVEGE